MPIEHVGYRAWRSTMMPLEGLSLDAELAITSD
jgi:hypothetical protein